MKKVIMFSYSVIAYAVAFAALLFWILSCSDLIPEISIDGEPRMIWYLALAKNLGLVALFGLQHSVMARSGFKTWLTRVVPKPIERSTFCLITGLLLAFITLEWEPMGGQIWKVEAGTIGFYILYVLFFSGWAILFISTFLINHFDLFGLRQTFLELQGKPYTQLEFRVVSFYKHVRHPLYFGGILGLLATPNMTVTHLVFAIGFSAYFVVGALFEEKDLIRDFGDKYVDYKKRTPMIIPFIKSGSSKD